MKKRKLPAGINFWPGYVDALSNVVLNMVFLVGLLAFALFIFGSGAGGRAALQASNEAAQSPDPAALRSAAAPPGPAPIDVAVTQRAAPSPAREEPVRMVTLRRDEAAMLWRIDFPTQLQTLPQAEAQRVAASVGPEALARSQVTLWAPAELSDPVHRRATYLRLMAVRDALLGAGMPSDQVQVRLIPGESSVGAGREVYMLLENKG